MCLDTYWDDLVNLLGGRVGLLGVLIGYTDYEFASLFHSILFLCLLYTYHDKPLNP